MDATGSMYNLLSKTKNAINKLFEGASKILNQYDIDPKSVEILLCCYRNYSSSPTEVFEWS